MSFRNVRITREQYQNVRRMTTDASIAKINALGVDRLIEIRYQFQKFSAEVTARRGEPVPVLYIEYCPADELKAKRWAYRKAIRETLNLVNALIKERTNKVSGFLAAGEAQPAPAEAVCEDEQSESEQPSWDYVDTSVPAEEPKAPEPREARYLRWLKERTASVFA